MRLRVIATDYDGTIAKDGILDPAVRESIANARERRVLVVIVTGRILSELRHVAGCLDFVDGVVAENGAVVALPNGHVTLLGNAPPLSLISKLTERGIDFKVGRCVVEMDADFANVAIELIRALELPLAITFNRGRMMLLHPEGDYSSLALLPNTVVLGGGRLLPHGDDLKMLLQQGLSVVLNLSHLPHQEKCDYIQHHLPLVADHRRERGFPHRILLDECHYFLTGFHDMHLLDSQLESYTLVTYRPSQLPESILKLVDVVVVTRLAEREEVDTLRDLLDDRANMSVDSHDWYEQLANLGITETALLPPTEEAEGRLRRFVVAPRLTTHVRHRTKYFDMPVANGREFVFTRHGQPIGESAATLRELAAVTARVDVRVLANHCQHHDFSRWIASLFCDHDLANGVRQLESKHKREASTEGFAAELCEIIERRYESS
ncbi:MAG: HAD hydrolase family protein [Planctomycetota bacterium]